jgi:hypothetical protein
MRRAGTNPTMEARMGAGKTIQECGVSDCYMLK